MAQQPFEQEKQPNILTQIHEGMTVCDDKGDKIGTVRQVYLGTQHTVHRFPIPD